VAFGVDRAAEPRDRIFAEKVWFRISSLFAVVYEEQRSRQFHSEIMALLPPNLTETSADPDVPEIAGVCPVIWKNRDSFSCK
jgi:hypothetical protein